MPENTGLYQMDSELKKIRELEQRIRDLIRAKELWQNKYAELLKKLKH